MYLVCAEDKSVPSPFSDVGCHGTVWGGPAVGGSCSSFRGVGVQVEARGGREVVASGVLSVSGWMVWGPGVGGVGGLPLAPCPSPPGPLSLRVCEGPSGWMGLLRSLVVVVRHAPYWPEASVPDSELSPVDSRSVFDEYRIFFTSGIWLAAEHSAWAWWSLSLL